jgi:hypothetical protein
LRAASGLAAHERDELATFQFDRIAFDSLRPGLQDIELAMGSQRGVSQASPSSAGGIAWRSFDIPRAAQPARGALEIIGLRWSA